MTTETENAKVTLMIGRGEKRHRGYATRIDTDPGTPWNRTKYAALRFSCSCPNTQNGRARHSAHVVADDWDIATCGS